MIAQIVFSIPLNKTFDYLVPDSVEFSAHSLVGRRALVSFGFKKRVGLIIGTREQSAALPNKLKSIERILDDEVLLTEDQLSLAQWMSRRTLCSFGEAVFSFLPPGRKAKASLNQTDVDDAGLPIEPAMINETLDLTEDQKYAAQVLHDAIYERRRPVVDINSAAEFLLYGIAAAGKTEVYFSAIRDVIQQGKSALILVPETGLACQMVEHLSHRFGEAQVVFWRSDIAPNERRQLWNRIRTGHAPIIVGPRSAILLPVMQLGLIVIDEEHDSAYKEDRKPRFHVRDVAKERARRSQCVVVYGSATPSLEIFYAAQGGGVRLLQLRHRAVPSSAPHLELVDLNAGKRKGLISAPLEEKITRVLKNHEQAILYLNRRGFHRYLRCPHCFWVLRCESCGVTLVAHRKKITVTSSKTRFECHSCSRTLEAPQTCPQCGKKELFSGGFGTERIEDELKEKFPWAKVLRWDRDAAHFKKAASALYASFRRGEYDILVGTQLVAHGFNFPGVTLVGILEADSPLYFPDFRASERTFQSIVQVAGRAGRALVTGDVVVQARHVTHPAIVSSLKMDMFSFAEQELKFREELCYPPFSHLIRLSASGQKNRPGDKIMEQVVAMVNEKFPGIGILGPHVARQKRAGKSLWQILLKVPSSQFDAVCDGLLPLLEKVRCPIGIEPDPQ